MRTVKLLGLSIIAITLLGFGCGGNSNKANNIASDTSTGQEPIFLRGGWVPEAEIKVLRTGLIKHGYRYDFVNFAVGSDTSKSGRKCIQATQPDIGILELTPCGNAWCYDGKEMIRFEVIDNDTVAWFASNFLQGNGLQRFLQVKNDGAGIDFYGSPNWPDLIYAREYFFGYYTIDDTRTKERFSLFLNDSNGFVGRPKWWGYKMDFQFAQPIMWLNIDLVYYPYAFFPSDKKPKSFKLFAVTNYDSKSKSFDGDSLIVGHLAYEFYPEE